jgi:hypothetical protein
MVVFMTGVLIFAAVGQAATTLVWVAGTQAPYYQYPNQDPNDLGANSLTDPIFDDVDQIVNVPYSRTMGVLTYFGAPGYDDSSAEGVNNVYDTIVAVRTGDPTGTIIVPGVSQGADVITQVIRRLEAEGIDTNNMKFVLEGNIASNVGGLKTALPFGFVPFLGITLGQGTSTTTTQIIQVRNQYDLATDVPQFFNPLAIANVFLGYAAYHTHEYVGPLNDPSHIITTNPSGLVTDVFIPYQGIVPLLRPLEALGVPLALLQILNQPVKDLIELGYDRSFYGVPGAYPDEPVRMSLVPPLHLLIPGLAKFVTDSLVAVQQLVAMAIPPAPAPAPAGPSLAEARVTPMSVTATADASDPPIQVESEPTQQPQVQTSLYGSSPPVSSASQLNEPEQSESVKSSTATEPTESEPVVEDSSSEEPKKGDKEEPKEKDSSKPKVLNPGNKFKPGDTVQEQSTSAKDNGSTDSPKSESDTASDSSTPSGASGSSDSSNSSGTSDASDSSDSDSSGGAAA